MSMSSLMFADVLIGAALVFAVAVVWVAVRATPGFSCDRRMGAARWDIKESWASTLTAVGAILGTVLSVSGVLPKETQWLPKAELAGLSLLFGALTVIAPFLYNATRRAKDVDTDLGLVRVQYQGSAGVFVAVSVITLWAVSGSS